MTIEQKQLIKTARFTGLWYLILAISGLLGFLIFHPQIFISGDPQKTLGQIKQPDTAKLDELFKQTIYEAWS